MTNNEFELYVSELKNLCDFFNISFVEMENSLLNSDNPGNDNRFWYYAQNGIANAANISKILWGSNSTANSQRQQFRELLEVNNESYIKNKLLRNSLEHIDERFNTFVSGSQGITIDRNISNVSNWITINGTAPASNNILRSYNPETSDFTFMNLTFNFKDAFAEIHTLEINVDRVKNLLTTGATYESLINKN